MLKLSFVEILFRGSLEAAIYVLGLHVYTKTKIDKTKLLKSIPLVAFMIYVIRMLPISYGIHTMLGIIMIIVVTKKFHQIDIAVAIKGTIITTVIQFICEVINMVFIQEVLKQDINIIFESIVAKLIYGIPSLLLSAMIMWFYYVKYGKEGVWNSEN